MITASFFNPTSDDVCLAEGHIVIEGRWKVAGIRVFRGAKGLFVSWPSFRETADKNSPRFPLFDVVSPKERAMLEAEVLVAVSQLLPEAAYAA